MVRMTHPTLYLSNDSSLTYAQAFVVYALVCNYSCTCLLNNAWIGFDAMYFFIG